MKIGTKRVFALLLALLLTAASLGGLSLTASAEEVETTDAYVLNYSDNELTASYGYNVPYMEITPFLVDHTIKTESGELFYSGESYPVIFNLINTTKLSESGDGAYASISAYCTDAATSIQANTSYRRINLEDSTYYASGAAGRIRAVILNSYPKKDLNSLQVRANAWLQSQGIPELVDLQSGEAILATQVAIWKIANGDNYTINSHYAGREESLTSVLSNVVDPGTAEQVETEHTQQNVESLYHYLYNLDGMDPKADAVSESTFENPAYTAVKENDGTYTVTISVNVNTTVGTEDKLTLTAVCGERTQTVDITAAGEFRFTFKGLPDRPEITLAINGYQKGGDVYLFDAEGERGASQTLVGYDDSLLPVHGEIVVTPDRILNIFKSTTIAAGKTPLANIAFDIYKVATLAQLESGEVILSPQPTAEETAKYQTSDNLIATIKTDAQGFASYNFTKAGQPDGVYMIVEQFSAATTGAITPFYLVVPGTTEDGSGYTYTLNVNPKNTTETGPKVQKDVTSIDQDSDTFDVGAVHTWIIRGEIPAGIAAAEKYVITDTLDHRLTYQKGETVVRVYTAADVELTLELGTHYNLTEGTVTVDERTVDRFSVSLTPAGMAYVAAHLGEGDNTPEIRVYFKAVINTNASMGEQIPNQAHLDYTNSAGIDYDSDSDIPEVHTGGLNLLKTDSEGNALEGASFKLARAASGKELTDENVEKETLNVNGQELTVVFVDFHTTADLSGDKAFEVATGEDGKAVLYGLAYGKYYLVETRAPAGYNLLSQPIEVTVNAFSHLAGDAEEAADNTVKVINTKFILPETGGTGTTMFTVAGLGIMAAACVLLLTNRKKRA